MKSALWCLAALGAACGAAGAQAQEAGDAAPVIGQGDAVPAPDTGSPEKTVFDGDWLAVGVGVGYSPGYDGSNDYVAYPLPAIAGSLGGIGIRPRAGGVSLDVLDAASGKLTFSLGPAARIRTNRHSQIKDPVVRAAGKLDRAFEIGPSAGVTIHGLLNDYDRLSFGVDALWDVAGAHNGMVVNPGVSYFTPFSPGVVAGVSAGAVWADRHYADYYYSVSPAQSAASGLPLFHADSGWHKAGVNAALGFDLDGDFRNGGFAIGLAGGYTRMLGDGARTPYTSVRGNANQWFGAVGIGYIF